jgi:hypothetical protein
MCAPARCQERWYRDEDVQAHICSQVILAATVRRPVTGSVSVPFRELPGESEPCPTRTRATSSINSHLAHIRA